MPWKVTYDIDDGIRRRQLLNDYDVPMAISDVIIDLLLFTEPALFNDISDATVVDGSDDDNWQALEQLEHSDGKFTHWVTHLKFISFRLPLSQHWLVLFIGSDDDICCVVNYWTFNPIGDPHCLDR